MQPGGAIRGGIRSLRQLLLSCSVHRFAKQIVAIVCITLLGCIYIQQSHLLPRQAYNSGSSSQSEQLSNFISDDLDHHLASSLEHDRHCQPQSRIVFLKAHKCASSTIQNLFMRYGFFNDLLFVLPAKGNYLGHPSPFSRHLVPPSFNYSILTHHSRLQVAEMGGLIPGATFITIIRNPVALFESMFHYYKLAKTWKVDWDSLNNASFEVPDRLRSTRLARRIGLNQMSFDLGLEPAEFNNRSAVEQFIQRLDGVFSLVMVSERMEESLVLLKELLCWDTEDMVVFKLNARNESYRATVNDAGLRQIRSLNAADQALYEHFSRKFEAAVNRFGRRRMAAEVARLRAKTAFYYRYCVGDTITANNSQIVRFVNTRKYNAVCRFLTNSELSLTALIRAEQLRRHPGSVFGNATQPGYSSSSSGGSTLSASESAAAASGMTTGASSTAAAASTAEVVVLEKNNSNSSSSVHGHR